MEGYKVNDNNKAIYFRIKNETKEIKQFSFFNNYSDNEGLVVSYDTSSSAEFLKKYLMLYPHVLRLVRIQGYNINDYLSCVVTKTSKTPFGTSMTAPLFIPADELSPKQVQLGIVDAAVNFLPDGVTNDIVVDVPAESSINVIGFFGKESMKIPEDKEYLCALVLENKSDVEREVCLFDTNKWKEEYKSDETLSISNFFGISDLTFASSYEDVLKSLDFPHDLEDSEVCYRKYNQIRVVCNNKEQLKQEVSIKTNDIFSTVIANEDEDVNKDADDNSDYYIQTVTDIKLPIATRLSTSNQVKVKLLPRTKALYIFKNVK